MAKDFISERYPAPAKLNLLLRVIGRRADGYHLLQTVFQFIDQCDFIEFTSRDDGDVRLASPLPGVPEETDLTVRAARALQSAANISKGVTIAVEKNLPMGGGLGGGSSDAATTLVALNDLWEAGLSSDELKAIGLRLGADVPVFIEGVAAWGEGVGEHLTPMSLEESWYLVVIPDCHVATGRVFCDPDLTRDNPPIKMEGFFEGRRENHCLPVVLQHYPEVAAAMDALAKVGEARLTGTGACVFASYASEREALEARKALGPSWRSFVAKGMNRSPLLDARR
jgi:4-diphosphocytidyl-2-C-methyl-D-erythritol kinase